MVHGINIATVSLVETASNPHVREEPHEQQSWAEILTWIRRLILSRGTKQLVYQRDSLKHPRGSHSSRFSKTDPLASPNVTFCQSTANPKDEQTKLAVRILCSRLRQLHSTRSNSSATFSSFCCFCFPLYNISRMQRSHIKRRRNYGSRNPVDPWGNVCVCWVGAGANRSDAEICVMCWTFSWSSFFIFLLTARFKTQTCPLCGANYTSGLVAFIYDCEVQAWPFLRVVWPF